MKTPKRKNNSKIKKLSKLELIQIRGGDDYHGNPKGDKDFD